MVDVPAVVIKDDEAPTGTFSVSPATGWAAFTSVTVTQDGVLADNWSPADKITRSVNWGDGTALETWTTGAHADARLRHGWHLHTRRHDHRRGATTRPDLPTSAVVVSADTTGPKVKLTVPSAKHSVKAWKTLRGKATDAGTGVKSVWLKAVEKRKAGWFGYNAATHTWVKAATKTKAFKKAKPFNRTTNAQHRWTAKLAKLAKGTLVYKVRATDMVGNRSATVTRTAKLTKS